MPPRPSNRPGYTLLELLVLMAVIAIGVATVVEFVRSIRPEFIQAISVTADGQRMLAAMNDGSVIAWDVATGERTSLLGPRERFLSCGGFSPDGKYMAWEADEAVPSKFGGMNNILTNLQTDENFTVSPDVLTGNVRDPAAFSADSTRLGILDYFANQLLVVDLRDAKPALQVLFPLDPTVSVPGSAMRYYRSFVQLSRDGQSALAMSINGNFVLWNLQTGQAARGAVPSLQGSVVGVAMSPVDGRIAVAAIEPTPTGETERYEIKLFDANMTLQNKIVTPDRAFQIAFCNHGKSLVELGDELEIWNIENESLEQKINFDQNFSQLAVSADGSRIALGDYTSIYVVEGQQIKKLGSLRNYAGNVFWLFLAFMLTLMTFGAMRQRRKMNVCVDCGKRWQEPKRRRRLFGGVLTSTQNSSAQNLSKQCPQCRLENLPTEELRKRLGKKAGRRSAVLFLLVVFGLAIWLVTGSFPNSPIGLVMMMGAAILVVPVLLLVVLLLLISMRTRWRLRRFRNADVALAAAQQAAGGEGRTEQAGALTVWADSSVQSPHPGPLPEGEGEKRMPLAGGEGVYAIPSVEELSRELDDCRQRLEELIGVPCPSLPESQIFVFAKTAAAQKFLPVQGFSSEMPAVFCGPWANIGCISIEGLRWQLRPLGPSLRSLMSYQHARQPRYGFWLNYAVHNLVARGPDRAAIEMTRRKVAVWLAEDSLLPLADLFRPKRFAVIMQSKQALPENYGRMLRNTTQWLSLVDYLGGPEATAERHRQLHRWWQAASRIRRAEMAIEEASGMGLADFERGWKDWAAAVQFDPLPLPPAEIAEIARRETIPQVQDSAAPIQRRIKAIRVLGSCGWSIGAETLLELFASPLPDIQLEAHAALRLLSGRAGTERADDWQDWLSSLPTSTEGRESCLTG